MKAAWKAAFWGLWVAGLVYVVLVLFNYLFFFSEYEAVRLASLSRYLNSWLGAMWVLAAGFLAPALAAAAPKKTAALLGTAAAGWALLGNPGQVLPPFVLAPRYAVQTTAAQQPYRDAAEVIRRLTSQQSPRVYVVASDDLGETTLRLDFELLPQFLPEHVSSIGPSYAEDDLLSKRMTRGEWAQSLAEGYDYVYIFAVNEEFIGEFGPLFAETDPGQIAPGQLYRVQAGGPDGVQLLPVALAAEQ